MFLTLEPALQSPALDFWSHSLTTICTDEKAVAGEETWQVNLNAAWTRGNAGYSQREHSKRF